LTHDLIVAVCTVAIMCGLLLWLHNRTIAKEERQALIDSIYLVRKLWQFHDAHCEYGTKCEDSFACHDLCARIDRLLKSQFRLTSKR
jgi:hypothetical protein